MVLPPGDLVTGEGHIVCGHCRNCLAGRRHLCPNTQGVGVNRQGAFAEYRLHPDIERLARRSQHSARCAFLFRSVRQCRSYRAFVRSRRRRRAHHRRGPDRLHGGRRSASTPGARKVVITDINPYRLDLARKMGATLALDVRTRNAERRDEGARHERRLRRRAWRCPAIQRR